MHLADLHIGKVINEFSMLEDQRYILEQILEQIKAEEIDTLLIAGDIYDRSVPSAQAVELMDWFLTETARLCTAVFLISGNHDSGERLSFGKNLFEKHHVYITGNLKDSLTAVELQDEFGSIFVYLLPFFRPAELQSLGVKTDDRRYETAVNYMIEQMNLDTTKRNILLTHHFVMNRGGQDGFGVECSDSENRLSVGGIEQVDYRIFDRFDYVALGHLHQGQKVGRETVRYAGSPLKYSFSEQFHQKSTVVFEMKEKGELVWKLCPLKPMRDLRKIRGKLKDLTEESVVESENAKDYIGVTLTDSEELYNAIGVLRTFYPNVMQLTFERFEQKEEKHLQDVKSLQQKTPLELVENFLETVSDCEIKKEDQVIVEQWIEDIFSAKEGNKK